MTMYEKENRDEEMISLIRALDTKLNMLLNDMDDLKETVTQLKFFIETAEEIRSESQHDSTSKTNWKRENL